MPPAPGRDPDVAPATADPAATPSVLGTRLRSLEVVGGSPLSTLQGELDELTQGADLGLQRIIASSTRVGRSVVADPWSVVVAYVGITLEQQVRLDLFNAPHQLLDDQREVAVCRVCHPLEIPWDRSLLFY